MILTWTLAPGYEDVDIYVYRSPSGVAISDDWELLNENEAVTGDLFYVDNTMYDKHDLRKFHYRLLAVRGDEEYDSPIVGMYFEGLNKTEYGLLYTMRRREYLRMRAGNGVKVLHCIPSASGPLSVAYDPQLGKSLDYCTDSESLGGKYDKYFRSCFQTWAEVSQAGDFNLEQLPDGAGFNETQKFILRLLAFPQPEPGHIIILPASDRRFILDGAIKPYLFKGFMPVAWDVEASYLSKSDIRHQFQIPTLLSDPDYPVRFTRAL